MPENVYVVVGVSKHFTGDCEKEIVGVRIYKLDAIELGQEWVREKNDQFKYEGKNIHASYEIVRRLLK